MDSLSDIFSVLRLRSDVYFRARLCGPFAVAIPAEARHVRVHYVRRGSCFVTAGDTEPALRMAEGDLAIVPHGAAQVLSDDRGREPVALADLIAAGALDDAGDLAWGSGEGCVELLCGFCRFDEEIAHPIVAALPPVLVLQSHELGAEPWVAAALRLLALEAERNGDGMRAVLARVLEIVFMQAIRRLGRVDTGYMAAIADPHISRALTAMHEEPHRPWTITDLARQAGMSRARFADRFTDLVGMPPIAYLTRWRLMKARQMLRETHLSTGDIAARCGYASVPSFTRRFKSAFGIGPGAFRRNGDPA